MYCVIALTVMISAVCFTLYYTGMTYNGVVLWSGIVAFTVMYHFWVRIIMGNVTKLFTIRYTQPIFRELPFEKCIYKLLRVRKWRAKVLTYNPDEFIIANHTCEELANTMSKAECDHWINELISISTMFFGLLWGYEWLFIVSAIAAMIFDAQFIVVQRFNRPIILRLMQREKRKHA